MNELNSVHLVKCFFPVSLLTGKMSHKDVIVAVEDLL